MGGLQACLARVLLPRYELSQIRARLSFVEWRDDLSREMPPFGKATSYRGPTRGKRRINDPGRAAWLRGELLPDERGDHQGLYRMQPVLGLFEDDGGLRLEYFLCDLECLKAALVEDLQADLCLGVVQRGKAMEELHLRVAGRLHEGSVDLIGEKLVDAGVPFLGRLTHREPHVGVEKICAAHGRGGVIGDSYTRSRGGAEMASDRLDLRRRPEWFWSGDPHVHAEQCSGDQQGIRRVVACVTEIAVGDLAEGALGVIAHCEYVGQHLGRVPLIGETVPHWHAGIFGEDLDIGVGRSSVLDPVIHPSEHPCGVPDRLLVPDLGSARSEIGDVGTLVEGADLEGAHRTGRGFLEDEGDIATCQALPLAPGALVVAKPTREVDEVEEFVLGEVGLFQKVPSEQVRHDNIFSGHKVSPMSAISPEVDPSEVGLDGTRLARIQQHFDHYLDDRRLPGFLAVVTRRGKVAYVSCRGFRDLENGLEVELDTRFRIYSMTKPITSVAAMMCYEEGLIALDDPLSKFVPEFAETRVFSGGSSFRPVTVPLAQPIRIWHLLTHTAGLTYGWMYNHPVDAMYRSAGFEWQTPSGLDLAECCAKLAKLPLRCQPGSEWNYSVATDVLGRVVEVASGLPLEQFFAERLFGPLGMKETGFFVEGPAVDHLAVLYSPDLATGRASRANFLGEAALKPPSAPLGGSGLVSTAADYHRFSQMLLGAGELDGVRLLGARTVAYMTRNHLPGGAELVSFGNPIAEETEAGLGFGLGFSVVTDPAAMRVSSNVGEYGWGGAASTVFWVDPAEELTALFFTQLLPSSTYPIRRQLKQLVHSAIVE